MSTNRANPLSELARLGFESLSETMPKLDLLVEAVGDWGRSALSYLAKAQSPDQALNGLLRLAEKQPKQIAKLLSSEDSGVRLCRLLGASEGILDLLDRRPELLERLRRPAAIPEKFSVSNTDRSALRRSYREQLFAIVDFDLSQDDPRASYQVVARALSDLTDQTLDSALQVGKAELLSEGRISKEDADQTALAVIAMGKTGAQELNYISDVDIIYVADGEAENTVEVATKLATRLAQVIGEYGDEPPLWEVDPNLRPEGKSGALVRTLPAHRAYYEKWAEPWEFQALLKARFAAGDASLGERYIATIKPMIWAYPERSRIVESARHLRRRVLEHLPANEQQWNLKLGRGGLRDVEFTVQLLQLVHGVADESLRVMDTLGALDALTDAGLLAREDRATLRAHYITLRTIEHRLQLAKIRRTHLFPTTESEQRRIGRALDLKNSAESFLRQFESIRQEVAALHDSVFYRPLLAATASLAPGEVQLSSEDVEQRLRAIGFVDPTGAVGHINALTSGVSRRATIQRTLLPVLLRWMAEGINPDRALLSFRRLSESLGETHWFLKMLRDSSGAAERLMRVLSSSEMISKLLEHTPDSSSWFGDAEALAPLDMNELEQEMSAIISRNSEDLESAAKAVRSIRRREVLRTAIGAVLGNLTMAEISSALSNIMDSYLSSMLEIAKRQLGVELDFGIVAMGRLGGRELGFGSDADAMLVYLSDDEAAQAKAEQITASLLSLVRDSLMNFELDLDLRPEGKSGVRVRSLQSYRAYYEKWSDTWEHQALLRARIMTGSEQLREEFQELIRPYRYPEALSQKQLVEIRRIKARVEAERLPQGADPSRHLKLGRGSVSDVEWLVQLYQLRFAHEHPELQTLSTTAAIESLKLIGKFTDQQAEVLRAAWLISSRARSALVLATDKLLDVLPQERRALDAMARIMEYSPGAANQLEQDYLSATRKARAVFEDLFVK